MISVCMATYNGEKYIKEQLESILCQLSADDEIIISDDGSTDKTLEIISSIRDSRIKITIHKNNKDIIYKHRKVTENFENALLCAKGDYIFLTDQDDIWEESKVVECKKALENYDFVVHNMSIIDEHGILKKTKRYSKCPLPSSYLSIIIKMNLWGCCMAFRRECLNVILPIPEKVIAHDYWIAAVCRKKYNCIYLDSILIKYREHFDSVSYKKRTSMFYKFAYRYYLFVNILKI